MRHPNSEPTFREKHVKMYGEVATSSLEAHYARRYPPKVTAEDVLEETADTFDESWGEFGGYCSPAFGPKTLSGLDVKNKAYRLAQQEADRRNASRTS